MAFYSQASQDEVVDQRFAELLKPIKDLTANWEVPLSSYLDEYIEELKDLDLPLGPRHGHKVK